MYVPDVLTLGGGVLGSRRIQNTVPENDDCKVRKISPRLDDSGQESGPTARRAAAPGGRGRTQTRPNLQPVRTALHRLGRTDSPP